MPGHYIFAECPCGYTGHAAPGARMGKGVRVIAYGKNKAGKADLVTVSELYAQRHRLEVIEDPALGRDSTAPNYGGPWSGYRCPQCDRTTMVLRRQGFWS